MADTDGLGDFFIYVFVVYPIIGWILKPGRFSKRNSLLFAIGFLACVASVKVGLQMAEKGPNHFAVLSVDRTSTKEDIKRAYKKMSLMYHPDKNDSPEAPKMFNLVKDAYDVLTDPDTRDKWERYGPEKIKGAAVIEETQIFFEMLLFYAGWGMLAFVLTLGKNAGEARSWIFSGQLLMFVVELYLKLEPASVMPDWLLPSMTKFELVSLFHSLFPAYMNGCRCIGNVVHVDYDERNRKLFSALEEQNKDVLGALRDIQVSMSNLQQQKGSNASATPLRITATGKLRELEEKLRSAGPVSEVAEAAAKEAKGSTLWQVAGYLGFIFLLNYAFGGGGK